METFKPNTPFRGRAALLATACLIVPLLGGEPRAGSSLAGSEVSRRSVAIDEARELLRKGDEAYTAGRYAEAVEAYAGARDLIPNAPVSAELRSAATGRYAQASVEQARVLSRNGNVAAAKAAVDKVLNESVAPDNPGALAFRAQLDDPIRTNPALTAEYAKDVDSVRRLLYTAQGAFDLGKFDQASSTYKNVLRIDPTNTAARRGMEQVAAAKSGYQESAYDHSRAELLGQVDSQWELQVPPAGPDPSLVEPGSNGTDTGFISVKNKIDRIIIPKLALEQASLEEALDFLRLRASENDTLELDPARKGVNFAVNLGAPDSAARIRKVRFDLQLANVPLSQALKYITDITHTSFTTDDFSVIISAAGSSSPDLVTRTYRVPPDFISSMSNGTAETAAKEDPFGAAPASEGLLAKRLGAQEALAKQGVAFPQGATASYTPATNTLRVVNTALNQDFVSQIIETLTKTEPVMVAVRVTMIKVGKTRLEELGFDWLLNPIPLDKTGETFLSGGTAGNTGGRTGSDFISPVNGTAIDGVPPDPNGVVANGVITNGNRSGSTAINQNSIDDLISNPGRGAQQTSVAPGVLAVTGLFSDGQVQALMRGLDQKKGVDLMARPSIVTRSGQASSIALVREFMYATEYEPPKLPNSSGSTSGGITPVTPATPKAFKKRDVGITLDVLPVAGASKQFVTVTLNPTFSDFDGFVNYGSPINTTQNGPLGPTTMAITDNAILMPVFSKQTLSTTVDVADGATVVVGSLITESVQNVEDQTPVLGSLPIVGRLFQSKARQATSTAIIFLVNVELMDPTGRRYKDR